MPPQTRSRRRRPLRLLLWFAVGLALAALYAWRALAPPAPLALPEPGAVLAGVHLVEPGVGRAERRTIVVEGGRIAAVREPQGPDPARYADRTVLPGFIDMHAHFPPPTGLGQTEWFAFLHLSHGVTSVRDAGDVDGSATAPARDGVREGRFPGPRVFACGYFVDAAPPLWKNSLLVTTAEEARAAVARIADEGFDCVKAYNNLAPEALAALKDEAKKRGLPVIGHVPRATSYLDAALDDVQHLTGLGQEPGDERPFPKNVDGWLRFDEAAMAEAARASAAAGIANTPTLVVFDRLLAARDLAAAGAERDVALLPRLYRDAVWTKQGSRLIGALGPEDFALFAQVQPRRLAMVRALRDAGAKLYAGTDTPNPFLVPGASLHRELRLLVEAGLTPEEALAAATTAPGAFLGGTRLPALGRIAEGAPADLLVFRNDPSRDLANLASLEAVVADGRLYTREMLDAQQARYDEYARGWLFDRISVEVTKRMLARLAGVGPGH